MCMRGGYAVEGGVRNGNRTRTLSGGAGTGYEVRSDVLVSGTGKSRRGIMEICEVGHEMGRGMGMG